MVATTDADVTSVTFEVLNFFSTWQDERDARDIIVFVPHLKTLYRRIDD